VIDYLPKGRNAYFRILLHRAYEEILTLHRLGLFEKLGRSLKTSNCIESLMALIGQRTDKVDSWRNSDQKER